MTHTEAAHRLATTLRAENDALARGDYAAAALLLGEKQTAAATLRDSLAGATPDPLLAATLRDLVAENAGRLGLALQVQGRIIEMVARAAKKAAPPPPRYQPAGRRPSPIGALALALRA